jgi:ribonucleoside-diphosphate reductase alpha chain
LTSKYPEGKDGMTGNLNQTASNRNRLANRRPSETFEIEVAGLRYTATVGRFPDGRIGKIFLQNHKPGSQSDANARDAAVAASLALQFGCPLEILQRALLRDARGNPSTPLGAAVDAIRSVRGQVGPGTKSD